MEKSDNRNNKREKPDSTVREKNRKENQVSEFDSMLKALMKVKPPQKDH